MKPEKNVNLEIKGLFRAGAFLLAFFITVAGIAYMIISSLGIIIWALGFTWMIILLVKNIKDKQKSGFKTANIIMKIVLMIFMVIFFILMLVVTRIQNV